MQRFALRLGGTDFSLCFSARILRSPPVIRSYSALPTPLASLPRDAIDSLPFLYSYAKQYEGDNS